MPSCQISWVECFIHGGVHHPGPELMHYPLYTTVCSPLNLAATITYHCCLLRLTGGLRMSWSQQKLGFWISAHHKMALCTNSRLASYLGGNGPRELVSYPFCSDFSVSRQGVKVWLEVMQTCEVPACSCYYTCKYLTNKRWILIKSTDFIITVKWRSEQTFSTDVEEIKAAEAIIKPEWI